jgi:predicted PolB exonuclease-like 3'-5' exonuclease
MSYLILDCETIPDTSVWTPPTTAAPEPEAPPANSVPPTVGAAAAKPKKRATRKTKDGDVFPPLFACRIVAIGLVHIKDDLTVQAAGAMGTSQFGDNEAALLTALDDYIHTNQPTVVTWGGRNFDMPVLQLRAFKNACAMRWYNKDYRYRYGDDHVDLCDVMTEYGFVNKTGFTLDSMAKVIGLPSKGDVSGKDVRDLWEKKQVARIEGYALCDAMKETFIFLRYLLMRGSKTREEIKAATAALFQHCANTNLGGVVFGAETKRLLIE